MDVAIQQDLRARQDALMEQQRFLDDQAGENKKVEATIAVSERVVAKQRIEFGSSVVSIPSCCGRFPCYGLLSA
jgi:hypothetical protein